MGLMPDSVSRNRVYCSSSFSVGFCRSMIFTLDASIGSAVSLRWPTSWSDRMMTGDW